MSRTGNAEKVAVVTGAAGGIGRATALELAGAGYALAVADRDEAALEDTARAVRERGVQVISQPLDVSDGEAQRRFAERCRRELGRVDVLVNNAGIARLGRFVDMTEKDWRSTFEVNLLGVVLGIQAFLPMLREARGHVVNLGSGTSLLPFPGFAVYGTLKVSVLWLSEYLRSELRDEGVTVSCVCPFLVKTGIGDSVQQGATRAPEWLFDTPEKIARQIRRAVERREFLPYGARSLHALHVGYRVAPWLLRPLLDQMTRQQDRQR